MMPLLESSVRKRLALGLASAMIFVGVAGSVFRGASSSKTRNETEVGWLKETDHGQSDQISSWNRRDGVSGAWYHGACRRGCRPSGSHIRITHRDVEFFNHDTTRCPGKQHRIGLVRGSGTA